MQAIWAKRVLLAEPSPSTLFNFQQLQAEEKHFVSCILGFDTVRLFVSPAGRSVRRWQTHRGVCCDRWEPLTTTANAMMRVLDLPEAREQEPTWWAAEITREEGTKTCRAAFEDVYNTPFLTLWAHLRGRPSVWVQWENHWRTGWIFFFWTHPMSSTVMAWSRLQVRCTHLKCGNQTKQSNVDLTSKFFGRTW